MEQKTVYSRATPQKSRAWREGMPFSLPFTEAKAWLDREKTALLDFVDAAQAAGKLDDWKAEEIRILSERNTLESPRAMRRAIIEANPALADSLRNLNGRSVD